MLLDCESGYLNRWNHVSSCGSYLQFDNIACQSSSYLFGEGNKGEIIYKIGKTLFGFNVTDVVSVWLYE